MRCIYGTLRFFKKLRYYPVTVTVWLQAVAKSVPQGRPGSKIVKSETCSSLSGTDSSAGADLLIDLNSPPSSPTLTARTSSDNYSLNSYSSVTNSQVLRHSLTNNSSTIAWILEYLWLYHGFESWIFRWLLAKTSLQTKIVYLLLEELAKQC